MKIEKVNENQILWSLDIEDLNKNQVSITDFLTGTPKVKELFREAIRLAERELGFQIEDCILNCRLKELSENQIVFSITKKRIIPEISWLIGDFGSLDEVIEISALLSKEMKLENSLYKLEDNYLLLLHPEERNEEQLAWCTVNLSEFVRIEAVNERQRAFIQEHGECIIPEEALQRLREIPS